MNFNFFRKVRDIETGRILSGSAMLPSFHMDCGPSGGEEAQATNASSLASTLSSDFGSRFSGQDAILQQLNNSLSPILAAGPGQQGYTPQEAAAISSATINANAGASRNAQQKWQSTLAGRGDDSGLTSGVDKQILGSVASASASNLANAQVQNTINNYQTGRANWQNALAGSTQLANLYSPEAFGSEALSGNQQAFSDQNTITEQKNQEQADIAGGITGIATSFLPGGAALGALKGVKNLFGGNNNSGPGDTSGTDGTTD